VEETDVMLREELCGMTKSGASVSKANS